MSRTYKDAPERIRAHKSGRTVHRHHLFGREITRPVPILGEDGRQLQREAGTYIYDDGWGKPEKHIRYVPAYRHIIKYRYADHCTVGEPVPDGYRNGWGSPLPCFPELPPEVRYKANYSSTKKFFRRNEEGRMRSHENQVLKRFTKEWNGGEELDDSDAPWRQHRHSMSWWD